MATNRSATTYLQIKRDDWVPSKAKVVRATQNAPTISDPDTIVVKVLISVPDEAFKPHLAVVNIPLEAVERPPIVVEAVTS